MPTLTRPRVCFVVPAHGRHELAAACLRQLARTCAELAPSIDATAIVVSDDRYFGRLADEIGFVSQRSPNRPLGRKWNDGFERACRELHADYVIPFGSDDIVDHRLISARLQHPDDRTIHCSRVSAVVNAAGTKVAVLKIRYHGGDGVRTIPARLLEPLGYRPAGEDKNRAIDTSMSHHSLRRARYVYHDLHDLQIVDFKSDGQQLNTYDACLALGTSELDQPFERLARHYPAEALDEIQAVYAKRPRRRVAA